MAAGVMLALVPVWFLFKALNSGKRSLWLANLALACGLCVLIPTKRFFPLEGDMRTGLLFGAQFVMVLVGLVGLVLAVLALRTRTSDSGTGAARPVIALLLSLLLALSSGFTAALSWLSRPENSQPWEWTSQQYGYRLRVPSSGCVESRMKDMDGAFVCRFQRMQAVVSAQRADAAEYAAAVQELRARMLGSNSRQGEPVLETTSTEAGWPCTRATVVERAKDGREPVLVSIAVVHWPENGLLFTVIFEGEIWPSSEEGKAIVQDLFTRSAHDIQLSLRPATNGGDA